MEINTLSKIKPPGFLAQTKIAAIGSSHKH